jgi:proteasome assembly chaperone (PAC2) family protein
MAGLVWEEKPDLRHPVMVAGFEGWNDAASAASGAAGWLTQQFGATKIASIDPEQHFDFQSVRPTVELVDGVTRSLSWPANEFFAVPVDPRDLLVLRGVEPNLRWPAFCREVLGVAEETGCEMVVTLGALLADVPHTRAVRVTGATTDPELMARLGLQRSRYEGPTGIVGVLHDTARSAGVASASLWAPVPHYVSTPPNPLATRALLDRLGQLLGIPFELGPLDEQAQAWRTRVDEVVSQDDDVRTYVGQLEERYDAEAETDVPSGEALADEVEQFLRDQRDDD